MVNFWLKLTILQSWVKSFNQWWNIYRFSLVVDVNFGRLHKNNWVNRYFCHNLDTTYTINEWDIFLNLYCNIYYFYACISKYSGASDIRAPDIRTLQFTDYFIWEQISYTLFCLNSHSRSGQSVFYYKICFNYKFCVI